MTVYQGTSFTPELTATGYALFRAGVRVSAGVCGDLAASLRRRHEGQGTRWRLLSPLAQAVLVIAFLRTNLTYAELAAGFGISESTCWRDIREGISVLADRGRRISLRDVARLAVKMGWDYLIVDGVHVPTVTFGRKTGGQLLAATLSAHGSAAVFADGTATLEVAGPQASNRWGWMLRVSSDWCGRGSGVIRPGAAARPGLPSSGADAKLAQLDQMARRAAATFLGMPAFGDIAGRAALPVSKDRP